MEVMGCRLWGGALRHRLGLMSVGMVMGHSPAHQVCQPLLGGQQGRADPAGEKGERWGVRMWGAKGGWHRCHHEVSSSPHLEAGGSGGTLFTSLSSGTLQEGGEE